MFAIHCPYDQLHGSTMCHTFYNFIILQVLSHSYMHYALCALCIILQIFPCIHIHYAPYFHCLSFCASYCRYCIIVSSYCIKLQTLHYIADTASSCKHIIILYYFIMLHHVSSSCIILQTLYHIESYCIILSVSYTHLTLPTILLV